MKFYLNFHVDLAISDRLKFVGSRILKLYTLGKYSDYGYLEIILYST